MIAENDYFREEMKHRIEACESLAQLIVESEKGEIALAEFVSKLTDITDETTNNLNSIS